MSYAHRLTSLALLLGLGACAGGGNEGEEVHLLAVLPKTGAFEAKGKLHENAIRMALEELVDDKKGGDAHAVMNRTFNVIPINSGDGPDVVEDLVRTAIKDFGDDVLGMVSSTGDAHEGSSRVALELGIPHFETSSGAHDEEFIDWDLYSDEELSYLMSSRALCRFLAKMTADLIHRKWPTGTVALMRGNLEHDKMHTRVIRDELRNLGFQGTVLETDDPSAAEEPWEDNRLDYILSYDKLETGGIVDDIQAVVDEHDPDVIFWHLRGDSNNVRFVADAQRAGYDQYLATCGMARTAAFIDPNENGQLSDYMVGEDAGVPDSRFFFVMRSPLPSNLLNEFKADYEARFGEPADTYAASVYDAAMLWGLGVLHAGDNYSREAVLRGIQEISRDGAQGNRNGLKALASAAFDGQDVDYVGVSGPMDVRADRTVPGSYYVERVVKAGNGYEYDELTDPARVEK